MMIRIVLAALALSGCGSTAPAKEAVYVTHGVGIAGAEVLRDVCVEPMDKATTQAAIDAVNARGCRNAVRVYNGLRRSRQTIMAIIEATDAAQCVGVSKASRDCDLVGAYVELSKAAAEWATALQEIQGAK